LTKLSAVDKYGVEEDRTLERLLDLDAQIFEMGDGYWVEIRATKVKPSQARPHGIDYGLCLLDPNGKRLVCFENSHPVTTGRAPSKKMSSTNDHRHGEGGKVKPYVYSNAETLLVDFWEAVEKVLKSKGVGP
jgi:Family of unknown function (DUF6516)